MYLIKYRLNDIVFHLRIYQELVKQNTHKNVELLCSRFTRQADVYLRNWNVRAKFSPKKARIHIYMRTEALGYFGLF